MTEMIIDPIEPDMLITVEGQLKFYEDTPMHSVWYIIDRIDDILNGIYNEDEGMDFHGNFRYEVPFDRLFDFYLLVYQWEGKTHDVMVEGGLSVYGEDADEVCRMADSSLEYIGTQSKEQFNGIWHEIVDFIVTKNEEEEE